MYNSSNLLSVENLSMHFGGIIALKDVSFAVPQNSISSLIGPNGAGKTTVFNCVTGFYKATAGEIVFAKDGKDMSLKRLLGEKIRVGHLAQPLDLLNLLFYKMFGGTHLVVRAGIARTFQNIRLFKNITVIENLLVAQHTQLNTNIFSGVFNTSAYRYSEKKALETAYYWLDYLKLTDYANRLSSELSYGHARKLEIARAMLTKPELICLDEPAAGLNPSESQDLAETIRDLRKSHNITILLIEHDMRLVMDVSDFITVLDHGEVIAQGKPEEIANNKEVIKAYLGESE